MSDAKTWPVEAIHMLRTIQQHHVQLSFMADQKANLLIGATFVVFTIAIGQSAGSRFSVPLLTLALFAFIAASLAAIAVMPAVSPTTRDGGNWLFFGTFSQVEESEFQEKMLANLGSPENVFKAMIHDLYQMGCVLQTKKYRYLGWAYRVFLVGLAATFLTFLYEQIAGPIL